MSPSSGAGAARDGWRRFLPTQHQMLWGVLGAFILLVIVVGVAYAFTAIPNPNSFATQQSTYLYYSDGVHKLARLGSVNRVDVPLGKVPLDVRRAVLAAEDRNFYSEPGISPTGIMRALITDLRGGDIQQGGSTITQQYVKNAYLSQQRTFTRKIKEILIAVKLGQSRSKDEILRDYLNTIYFGRGANGIEAASIAYFGKNVWKLDVAQGAVLAAAIQAPGYYDPYYNKAAAVARWHYVIDGMVKEHWLTADQASRMSYPAVRDPQNVTSGCTGPTGFICQAVHQELVRDGFDDTRLAAGGYKVITTIDYRAQNAAVTAMGDAPGGDHRGDYQTHGIDKGREAAMVSVQPGDGAIRAMYGGSSYCTHKHRDDCLDLTGVSANYTRSPGSSFKPYTLIAALKQGIGLDSTYAGPPHIDFPGTNGKGISNSQNESCGSCTLTEALARSINTIFVPLADKVGPDNVANVAYDAGVSKKHHLDPVPTITLGTSDVSPLDQAVGYATIAAQGIRARPYIVAQVRTTDGRVVFRAHKQLKRVFAADVMADTTYAMTQVIDNPAGTAAGHQLTGRPAAGKTGTNGGVTGNFDAWFIGFTPQLSTAVWYGNADKHKEVTENGAPMYGGMAPADTWQQMMNAALAGKRVETFPPPAHVGATINSAPPTTASPSPTGSPSGSASPTASPSATASATSPITPPTPLGGSSSSPGGGGVQPQSSKSPKPPG